jgi:putative MATE family efflux protein
MKTTAQERRKYILEDNQWKVIFTISLPVVIYDSLSQIFQFVDTLIAANISSSVVSIVSFISQISTMLSAVGSGLAIGGGIIISRFFGAGDMEKVRSQISTLFFTALGIAAIILCTIIPFAQPFLRLLRMPEDLMADGTVYFIIEITGLLCLFINTIYLSIEKALGNTKMYMWYNLIVVVIKTVLNIIFIYILGKSMIFLPLATLIAQSVLTVIALINLASRKNPCRISFHSCTFHAAFLKPLANLSIPIFLEKFIFAFGKVIVNSMCAFYGSSVIGALGVSNRLGGLSTNPPAGFQEGETSLISQNLGNRNPARALQIFYKTFVINMFFSLICFIVTGIFQDTLVSIFSHGDAGFAAQIGKIYMYERLDTILIAVNTSVMGLLYGFGRTRISLTLNLVRLFIFRIPPLYFFIHFTQLGIEAVGIAMLVSNCCVGITSGIVAWVFIRRTNIEHKKYEKESVLNFA